MKIQYACPNCRKASSLKDDNPWRPFCSERCRLIDLGEWMNENNKIASQETELFTSTFDDDEIRH